MQINRIVFIAIAFIIILTILQLFIKISLELFGVLIFILIIIGIWGLMKGK